MPRTLEAPLQGAIDSFLRTRWDLKPNTLRTYRLSLGRFARLHTTIGELTAENVDDYLASIADHRTMARNDTIALRQFSQWATKSRIFARDPLDAVSLPRGGETRRVPFTPTDVKAIIDTAGSGSQGVRDKAIVVAALSTGLRPGELWALELEDINLHEGWIRVRRETTKSASGERRVPLDPQCHACLDAYLSDERLPRPGKVWLNAHGDPMTFLGFMSIWHRLRDRLREQGIDGVQAYRARHTAISNWASNGVATAHLQQIAGHRSIITTQRYIGQFDFETIRRNVPDSFTARYGRVAG